MNEKQFLVMIRTINTINNLKKYSINNKNVINEGYNKYINLIYCIINKILNKLKYDISVVDYIYEVFGSYKEWKFYFIFKENNFSKIYLTINNEENVDILINVDSTEIKIYMEFSDMEYFIIKFKKQEEINNVIYCEKNGFKREKNTVLNNLYEIINDIENERGQKDNNSLKRIKETFIKIQNIFDVSF